MIDLWKYTLRLKTGNGYVTREVIAHDDKVKEGLLRFIVNEKGAWSVTVAVENLIDMEVEEYIPSTVTLKEQFINQTGSHGPVETVLPKEHE